MSIKNNRGVSIVMLVITIVLMIMLTSIAIYYSNNIAPEANLASSYASLLAIKDACDRAMYEVEADPLNFDEYYFFGDSITKKYSSYEVAQLAAKCGLYSTDQFSNRTYEISDSKDVDNRRILKNLEISSISKHYVVDLENEKYYLVDGVRKSDGFKVFELKDMFSAYQMLVETH